MLFGLFSNFQAFLKMLIRDEITSFSLKWVLVPTSVQLRLAQDEIARIRKRKRGGNMQLHVSVMFT